MECQKLYYDRVHEIQSRELGHERMNDIGVLGMTCESIMKLRRTEKARNKVDRKRRKVIEKMTDAQLYSKLDDNVDVLKVLEHFDK